MLLSKADIEISCFPLSIRFVKIFVSKPFRPAGQSILSVSTQCQQNVGILSFKFLFIVWSGLYNIRYPVPVWERSQI